MIENIKELVKSKTFLKYLTYSACIIAVVVLLVLSLKNDDIRSFFMNMENKTFDARQSFISKNKKVNKNIKIITIDEHSYEYLFDKYGEWPIRRGIYADMIEYLQKQKPSAIAFDLLFIKSMKKNYQSDDLLLAKTIAKYDNVYTSINFDDQDYSLRAYTYLPDYLKAKIVNNSKVNLKNPNLTFKNCRAILKEIIDSTPNIGHITIVRDKDGIIRTLPMFISYKKDSYPPKEDYYSHLALKVGLKYLKDKEGFAVNEFKIDEKGNLVLGKRKIPMTHDGLTILNWYGESGMDNKNSFEYVPFWRVEKTMYNYNIENEEKLPDDYFKDSIVYVGSSATALFDIKSVPTDLRLPGVEIHTTFINNLIDDNFIKRVTPITDILITLLLSLFVGFFVLRSNSNIISATVAILVAVVYIIFATELMQHANIWIGIILPILSMALVFTTVYILKYFLKSKDFEYTYALATTDGLTELYNHRYFQEQMLLNAETSKRYNSEFSLILIDIDYFKKFNDNYGHQAGDAVLKQVAQVLKKNVRSTDIVCRYGGEEMAIILSNTNNEEARTTAQKICEIVAQKSFKLGNDLEKNVTISLGVATYPHHGITPQEMIKYSDECLYKAKENGRNQVGYLD